MISEAKRRHNDAARLFMTGDLSAAEAAFRGLSDCPEIADEVRYMLALTLLARGDYAEGFAHYEARWKIKDQPFRRPPALFRRWRGEPLTGKRLLVWPEQGHGDQIMLSRLAFQLADAGTDVHIAAPSSLVRLLEGRSSARIIDLGGSFEVSRIDYAATDFELASGLGLTPSTIPFRRYLDGSPRGPGGVGVATRGNPGLTNDANRSLSADAAEALLTIPGAFSLLPEDSGAKDFQDTADLICGAELVITADTSVAHLAGALGKPVWILLPHLGTDWRWGRKGEHTPWYPSARLIRQEPGEPWTRVIERVRGDLRRRRLR